MLKDLNKYIFNRQETAEILGIVPSTLDGYDIQNHRIGRIVYYDIRDAIRYKFNLMKSNESGSLVREQIRLTKARAEKMEIENETTKENLIPTSVVLNVWNQIRSNIKAQLFSIPDRMAPILVGLTASENKAELQSEMTNVALEIRETITETT